MNRTNTIEMTSEVFENRQDDFKTIISDLNKKMQRKLPQISGEARKRLCREIERGQEESNILLLEMEEEARKAPPMYRMDMMSQVRNHKQEAERLALDLRRATDFGSSSNNAGFYEEEDNFQTVEESQRARLLQGTRSLTATSESIARSHRVAAETDAIGTDIIDELGSQRESLVRTRDRLHETDSNLSKSKKILQTMSRRIMTNKLILTVIIVLELGILGGVIYWKFFKS